MPVIKRYPNRKLYDTKAKQYITLDGLAALVRQREDVQVLDNTTGEDLTALTLSQIIFEQQKKHSGFLPHAVLAGLVQAGGQTWSTLRTTLCTSLGLVRWVDEEIERRVRRLVRRGVMNQEDSRVLLELLLSESRAGGATADPDEQRLARALASRGVPTRDALEAVAAQLDALAARLEELGGNR
jgi:polyhydroxyalkanoate synthesis repressor PhaR